MHSDGRNVERNVEKCLHGPRSPSLCKERPSQQNWMPVLVGLWVTGMSNLRVLGLIFFFFFFFLNNNFSFLLSCKRLFRIDAYTTKNNFWKRYSCRDSTPWRLNSSNPVGLLISGEMTIAITTALAARLHFSFLGKKSYGPQTACQPPGACWCHQHSLISTYPFLSCGCGSCLLSVAALPATGLCHPVLAVQSEQGWQCSLCLVLFQELGAKGANWFSKDELTESANWYSA